MYKVWICSIFFLPSNTVGVGEIARGLGTTITIPYYKFPPEFHGGGERGRGTWDSMPLKFSKNS